MGNFRKLIFMIKTFLISLGFTFTLHGFANSAGTVEINSGQYFIGTNLENGQKNEKPRHTATLTAYVIDKEPVSIKDFVHFLDTLLPRENGKILCPRNNQGIIGQLEPPMEIKRLARVPSYWISLTETGFVLNSIGSDSPAFNVSWEGADAYCRSLGKSLPTEAQWEAACSESSKELILSSKEEWTADWYSTNYYKKAPIMNPINYTNTGLKSVRGGADKKGKISCSARLGLKPDTAVMNLSFRCVEQQTKE